jgi:hypothetical protein
VGLPSAGLPNFGGALAGLINQIAQVLGPYSDAPADSFTDPQDEPRDAKAPADPVAADPAPKDSVAEVKPVATERQSAAAAPLAAEVPPPASPVPEPAATPTTEPPTTEPLPTSPAEPAATDDTATPCEIAADELPQVGQ